MGPDNQIREYKYQDIKQASPVYLSGASLYFCIIMFQGNICLYRTYFKLQQKSYIMAQLLKRIEMWQNHNLIKTILLSYPLHLYTSLIFLFHCSASLNSHPDIPFMLWVGSSKAGALKLQPAASDVTVDAHYRRSYMWFEDQGVYHKYTISVYHK